MPYKDELKKGLHELLQRFFQEEQNNRLTSFNLSGLVGTLNALLDKHEIKKESQPGGKGG